MSFRACAAKPNARHLARNQTPSFTRWAVTGVRLAVMIPVLAANLVSASSAADQYSDKNQCSYLSADEAQKLLGAKLTSPPQAYADIPADAFCAYVAGSGTTSIRVYVHRNVDVSDWRRTQSSGKAKAVSGVGDRATWELVTIPNGLANGATAQKALFSGIKGTTSVDVMINRYPKPLNFEQSRAIFQKMFSRIR